ncbi:hypothetical protein [Thermosphaera aggregans]|jgi:hypothetical protein|uniref:Uncharacterized protein n=1 Tax=Thermosphaera aggregans (strain DSM 11486 / M11TL) TaxID=633148 RepID=D5U2P5_THEAM|nr:hypothetical protein [Thermosphaera aggregans]ADG91395.1 conserved hypothetical protein [Thermosphaera aggregans DSM 11486]
MVSLTRRFIEELLIILGLISLLLIFQPVEKTMYTIGWGIILFSTLAYVIFTLIPSQTTSAKNLVKNYFKTLLIVLIVVLGFLLISIMLTPYLV